MRSRRRGIVAVMLGLALLAGHVMAQAPDFEGAGGERGARGRVRGRRGGAGGLFMLLAMEGAQVVNTEKGVDITITTENAAQVEALQRRVNDAVTQFNEAMALVADAAGNRAGGAAGRGGLMGLFAGGEVTVAAANVENGAVVSVTSNNAELVAQLQEQIPQMAERMQRGRAALRGAQPRRRELIELLAGEDVQVEAVQMTVELDRGLTVTITSKDPQILAKIKEMLKEYANTPVAPGMLRMGAAGFGQGERGGFRFGDQADQGGRRAGQGRRRGDAEGGGGRRNRFGANPAPE